MHSFRFLSVLNLLVFGYSATFSESRSVKIKSKIGIIVGNSKTIAAFGQTYEMNQFLGIPYAEPPVNQNRFKKPLKKMPLTEPYIATQFGPSCLALNMEMEGKRKPDMHIDHSEDCLFLNIFSPEIKQGTKYPVMIFFHPGGFNVATATIFPGNILSAYGDIIVITVNYRLSVFGFLSTGDDASPGNYGLWDQQMAIEWVYENIHAFGGNGNLITVSGDSAGSASAIYQAMFPGNEGKIRRAIGLSGSPLCPWAFNPEPLKTAEEFGVRIGCDSHGKKTEDLVECIRSKSADEIMRVLNDKEQYLVFPMEFVSVVDNDFIKYPPDEMLNENAQVGSKERQLLSNCDFMTGVTTNEGVMMITTFVGVHGTEQFTINGKQFTDIEVPKIAKIMFHKDASEIVEELVIHEYFPFDDPDNETKVREAFLDLSSDYVFNIQAVKTAKLHASLGNKKTYFYIFDAMPSQHMLQSPSWSNKPNHADDLTFLFGFDNKDGITSWTMPFTEDPPANWEIELSKTVMDMWSNFVKTGDPNAPRDIESYTAAKWPPFTDDEETYFRISRQMSPQESIRNHPFAKKSRFWYKTLPSVIQVSKTSGGLQYCPKL